MLITRIFKKSPRTIFFALIFFLSLLEPATALGQNKLGINIAARHEEFEDAADLVGPGGWVMIMASPGNADELKPILVSRPEVNIILRGHCPSDPLGPDIEENRKFALSWVATLGGLDTAGRKIFFMPWNEPNMTRECQGTGDDFDPNNTECAPFVRQYIAELINYLSQSGLLHTKVELLSPMVNQHHANYRAFIQALGGRSFFNQFYGISMNLYDNETCGSTPLCHPDPYRNAGKFNEVLNSVGLGGLKVFSVETGIIDASGTCPPSVTDCPFFDDSRMTSFISQAYPAWNGASNFVMFSPLSYNPETNPPSWIYGGSTANFYETHRPSSGAPFGGSPPSSFSSWRNSQGLVTCPNSLSTYIVSGGHCGFCAGGSYLTLCKPIKETDEYGEELSWKSINIPEEFTYDYYDDKCLTALFSGKMELSQFRIPFVDNLNEYFLSPFAENLNNRLEKETQDFLRDYGVLEKLTSKEVQDSLRLGFLEEVIAGGPDSRYENFRVAGKGPQELKDKFKPIQDKEKKELPLSGEEKEFREQVWPQIPLFANEESKGEVVFYATGIDGANNLIKTSVPEVYRLNKVSTLLSQMFTSNVTPPAGIIQGFRNEPGLVLAQNVCPVTEIVPPQTNDKETRTGYGPLVCTKDKIQPNPATGPIFEGERVIINDADPPGCQKPGESLCTGSNTVGKCCSKDGKNGKCDFYYTTAYCATFLNPQDCGSCWTNDPTTGPFYNSCCIPTSTEKTVNLNDVNLNILNRVPYLKTIAENTVGPKGFFRIFIPYLEDKGYVYPVDEVETVFEEVPGESKSDLKIEIANSRVNPGVSFSIKNLIQEQISLLFHKLGTIINVKEFVSDYLLPPVHEEASLSSSSQPGNLNYALSFKDPTVKISPINKNCVIDYVKNRWPTTLIDKTNRQGVAYWNYVLNQAVSNSWDPAFVLALWIEESGANAIGQYGLGCTAASFDIESQLGCLFSNYQDYKYNSDFERFMCRYSEGTEKTPCQFIKNPNFPRGIKYWYDQLTGTCTL